MNVRLSLLLAGLSLAPFASFGQLTGITDGLTRVDLQGTIEDVTGAPIAQVSVTLIHVERVLWTTSRANGSFRFDNIVPGDYELEIAASGFATQNLSVDLRHHPALLRSTSF